MPDTLINPYLAILLLGFIAGGFLITMLVLASVIGPKNRSKTKQIPFECGSVSVGSVQDSRFNVRFYLVALLFILFDVEVIFMYPWAMVLSELRWFAFIQMAIFITIITVGLAYEWGKGVLNWNEE